MITDWITWHDVLLPLNQKYDKNSRNEQAIIWERNDFTRWLRILKTQAIYSTNCTAKARAQYCPRTVQLQAWRIHYPINTQIGQLTANHSREFCFILIKRGKTALSVDVHCLNFLATGSKMYSVQSFWGRVKMHQVTTANIVNIRIFNKERLLHCPRNNKSQETLTLGRVIVNPVFHRVIVTWIIWGITVFPRTRRTGALALLVIVGNILLALFDWCLRNQISRKMGHVTPWFVLLFFKQ